jgi:Family of unknown function (DUF5357)
MKQSDLIKKIQSNLQEIKPFSWETLLLLSLFSWFVFLILKDPDARNYVALFGWLFLIMGVDWAFFDEVYTIPWLKIKMAHAPWITAVVVSAALYSNRFLISTVPAAFVAYPLLVGAIGTAHAFLKEGPRLKTWKEIDKGDRQFLVLFILLSLLLSCWMQLHFVLDGFLQQYPSIAAEESVNRSGFVVPVNPNRPVTQGVVLLDQAEAVIREELRLQELRGLSWRDGQRFVANINSEGSPLNIRRVRPLIWNKAFGNPAIEESKYWVFGAAFVPQPSGSPQGLRDIWFGYLSFDASWMGPTSTANGYRLTKRCWVPREPEVQRVSGLAQPRDIGQYLLKCDAPVLNGDREGGVLDPTDEGSIQVTPPPPIELPRLPGSDLVDQIRTSPFAPDWLKK